MALEEVYLLGRVPGVEEKEYRCQSPWVSATLSMMSGEAESVLPGVQLVKLRDSPLACLPAVSLRLKGPTIEALPWNTDRGTAADTDSSNGRG